MKISRVRTILQKKNKIFKKMKFNISNVKPWEKFENARDDYLKINTRSPQKIINYLSVVKKLKKSDQKREAIQILRSLENIDFIETYPELKKFFDSFFEELNKSQLVSIVKLLFSSVTYTIHPEIFQLFNKKLQLKKRIYEEKQEFIKYVAKYLSDYTVITVFLKEKIYKDESAMNLFFENISESYEANEFIVNYFNQKANYTQTRIFIISTNGLEEFIWKIPLIFLAIRKFKNKERAEIYDLITQNLLELCKKEMITDSMGINTRALQLIPEIIDRFFMDKHWYQSIPIELYRTINTYLSPIEYVPYIVGYQPKPADDNSFYSYPRININIKTDHKKIASKIVRKFPQNHRIFLGDQRIHISPNMFNPRFDYSEIQSEEKVLSDIINYCSPTLKVFLLMSNDQDCKFSKIPLDQIWLIYSFYAEQEFEISKNQNETGEIIPNSYKVKTFSDIILGEIQEYTFILNLHE